MEERIYFTGFRAQLKNMGKMGLPDPVSFATAAEEKKKDIYREKNLAKVNKFCNTTKAKKKCI